MLLALILLPFALQSLTIGDFTFVEKRWAEEVDEDEEVEVAATLRSGGATLEIGCDHHLDGALTARLLTDRALFANRPPIQGIQRFGEPRSETAQVAFSYAVEVQPAEAHTGNLRVGIVEFRGAARLASSLAKGSRIVFKLPGPPLQAGQAPVESEIAFSARESRRAMERVAKSCENRLLQAALAQQ